MRLKTDLIRAEWNWNETKQDGQTIPKNVQFIAILLNNLWIFYKIYTIKKTRNLRVWMLDGWIGWVSEWLAGLAGWLAGWLWLTESRVDYSGSGKMREMNESVGFMMMKMAQLWVDFILKEQTTYKPYNLQTNWHFLSKCIFNRWWVVESEHKKGSYIQFFKKHFPLEIGPRSEKIKD